MVICQKKLIIVVHHGLSFVVPDAARVTIMKTGLLALIKTTFCVHNHLVIQSPHF